jgi:hypothetical protein
MMNYNQEKYHKKLADIVTLCATKLETMKAYTDIMITQEKRLSDDSSQYIAAIESAFVKMNRAVRSVSEAIDHINKAEERI